jgi:hypothetical protein
MASEKTTGKNDWNPAKPGKVLQQMESQIRAW